MKTEFDILYSRLNKAQKQAVDSIEGPVMVIAGPGTGKTSILTLRIANIIRKTDISPDSILALTFTESGVHAMRKKLVSIIGTAAYMVNISTFHSFCNDIIKQYPERFPRIIGSIAITDIDQIALMEKIIDGNAVLNKKHDFKILRPYGDPYFYIKPALSEIRNLKRDAIGIEDFSAIIKKQKLEFDTNEEKLHTKGPHKGKMKGEFIKIKERIEKNEELLELYKAYEEALLKKKYYDFEDMIVEVVKTLKNDNDLLLILQESYQYILADEHQDANNSQNAILELLSNFHNNPNLFMVGDEKQAIFRFQGASLENFFRFKKLYPEAKLINLEENYRSTQNILDASHSLIENNQAYADYKRINLQARLEMSKEPIHIVECANSESEYDFIVNSIRDKIKSGIKPVEIAILYRDNKDSFNISKELSRAGIAYRIESDNDILKDENIRKILLILETVNDLSKEERLAELLFIDFLNIPVLDIYKTIENSRKEKIKLIKSIQDNFPDLYSKLIAWSSHSHNKSFIELFEIIIRESGYIEYILSKEDSLELIAILEEFFNELKKLSASKREYYLKDFIEHLNRVREHGILTRINNAQMKNGVRLMTAHKSKGLEFDCVYIMNAYDGHWSNKSSRNLFYTIDVSKGLKSDNTIDDERRLFYVAITRARKEVYISYAKEGSDGKELLPSQFISEISDEYKIVDNIAITKGKHNFTNSESVLHDKHNIHNREYLRNLFIEQGISVTALNNYLECPWQFFFTNLIRLPSAKSKHQMYGTAIHETLKTFFDKYREEDDMSRDELLSLFESNLNKATLSEKDYTDSLNKGKLSLGEYYRNYKGSWCRTLITEYSIKGVHFNTGLFDLLLKGAIDKIELIDEYNVNVIDYKTGKRKSENKDRYHRQLVFYKLLLDLEDKKKYNMISGELDFIEPDARGKFHRDRFEIVDNNIDELKSLLSEKANEIYNVDFWDKNCGKDNCEFCLLSKSLKK